MNPCYPTVSARANHRCEYCQAPEVVFNFPFEVEHIIPLSQNGQTEDMKLALACRSCNLRKSNRIKGTVPSSDAEARFFHPRNDQWHQHFEIDANSGSILGITDIGKVTAAYLEMNSPSQIAARQLWIRLGLFP